MFLSDFCFARISTSASRGSPCLLCTAAFLVRTWLLRSTAPIPKGGPKFFFIPSPSLTLSWTNQCPRGLGSSCRSGLSSTSLNQTSVNRPQHFHDIKPSNEAYIPGGYSPIHCQGSERVNRIRVSEMLRSCFVPSNSPINRGDMDASNAFKPLLSLTS